MFLNKRLQDIKWLEGHYPRGYVNGYREALLRRNEAKRDIGERRGRLKVLMEAESKFGDKIY